MRRLLTPLWLARHALAAALVVAFLALGRWQYGRATDGNALSWAYAFQWPLFALFVAGMWARMAWAETRDGPPSSGPPPLRPKSAPVEPPWHERTVPGPDRGAAHHEPDDEHDAYNRYLAWLAANPDRRPSEYRG